MRGAGRDWPCAPFLSWICERPEAGSHEQQPLPLGPKAPLSKPGSPPDGGRAPEGPGGDQGTDTQRPKGEGAPEAGGGAGPPPANEASRRTTGGGPSAGSPTRRAAPTGRSPTARTKQNLLFCLSPGHQAGAGSGEAGLNKTQILFVFVRSPARNFSAACSGAVSLQKVPKTGPGWRQPGGVLRHPPKGALCFVLYRLDDV